MKRLFLITGIVFVILILAVAGLGIWVKSMIGKPLYQPGIVRAGANLRAPLDPPDQPEGESFWLLEPNIKIYHFSQGSGRPVLMVHGGPGFPFHDPYTGLELLGEHFEFVYYHQRGCGKSTRPFDTFSSSNYWANMIDLERTLGLPAQIADIERIRRILGQDKLVLVGHSFGAFLASLYAAEFPEHVDRLVLIAPANMLVMPAQEESLFDQIRKRLPDEMKGEYSAYLAEYFDFGGIFMKTEAQLAALQRRFLKYYRAAYPEDLASIPDEAEFTDNGGWAVYAMYFSMGKEHDYRSAMRSVQAPVLVVHGERDLQSETSSRTFAQAFPNAKVQVIENAGHFVYEEQPEAFARVLSEFLD